MLTGRNDGITRGESQRFNPFCDDRCRGARGHTYPTLQEALRNVLAKWRI